MAEHHRKPRSGDRHSNPARAWRPDKALWEEAVEAIKTGLSWTMTGYLTECLKYVVGLRKTFPPRSPEAEVRAAALPDDDPIRPSGDIDT
jgi:hypothetical protein